jgi:hypothetical protein
MKRNITFTMTSSSGEVITMDKTFESDCTWMTISEMYFRFLRAVGYELSMDEVGAEFESNVSYTGNGQYGGYSAQDAFGGNAFQDTESGEESEFDRDAWLSEQYTLQAEENYNKARREYLQKFRELKDL